MDFAAEAVRPSRPLASDIYDVRDHLQKKIDFDFSPKYTKPQLGDEFSKDGILASAIARSTTIDCLIFNYLKLTTRASHQLSAALAQNSSLKTIDMYRNSLEADPLWNLFLGICQSKSITTVKISFSFNLKDLPGDKRPLFMLLTENQRLKSLKLINTDFDVEEILEGLAKNETLRVLDLSGNPNIFDLHFSSAIIAHKTPTSLTLNQITNQTQDDELVQALVMLLQSAPNLTKLALQRNHFRPTSSAIILNCLLTPNQLQKFSFGANRCEDTNIPLLSKIIATNTTLTSLNIASNSLFFTEEAFNTFLDGLSQNTTLKCLDITNNERFGSDAAQRFADVLRHNSTLEYLNLSFLSLHKESLGHIVEGARDNYSLQKLRIIGNEETDTFTSLVEGFVMRNQQIAEKRSAHFSFCLFVLAEMKVEGLVIPREVLQLFRRPLTALYQRGATHADKIMFIP